MAGSRGGTVGRSVTSKVASVLDAFTATSPELSLNELARRAGLPLSTTYRLAGELVEWGGLERGSGGGYRVGLRLWKIGSMAPRGPGVREVARPFMQDLCETTHENVHLAVLDGLEAAYVEKCCAPRSVAVQPRLGGRLPLYATGGGTVLLAFASEDFVAEVIASGRSDPGPHPVAVPRQLARTLAHIRRTGVAVAREEMMLGFVSVAAPVLDSRGRAAAALSLVLPAGRSDIRRLSLAVRTAAVGATRELRTREAVVAMPGAGHAAAT
jgi:DNA-binding IclR family transcriptional regulator